MKSAQSFFTFKSKKLHVAAGNKKIWEKNVWFYFKLKQKKVKQKKVKQKKISQLFAHE